MKQFVKTTGILFKKDFKDTLRNPSLLILLLLPLLFGMLYQFVSVIEMPKDYLLMLTTLMALSMIPLSFLATMIAEEKEKHTLRTLMMSGVSAAEFITGKVLVSLLFAEIICVINYFILGLSLYNLPLYFLVTVLGSLPLLMMGAAIGILCKDQMSAGALSAPLMLVFLMPSLLQMLNPVVAKIAYFTPMEQTMRLFDLWSGGSLFSANTLYAVLIIAVWACIGFVLFGLSYRKKRLDG